MDEAAFLQAPPQSGAPATPTVALAQRLKLRGQLDDAERVFKAVLRASDQDKNAWFGLGLLFRDRSRLEDACYCLWRASRLDPNDRRLLLDLGKILIRQKDYERAATVFASIVKANPKDLQAYINLSALRRDQKSAELGRRIFESGVHRHPVWTAKCVATRAHGRILRFQGVEHSNYILMQIGDEPELILSSGNFPTERFWNEGRFTTASYLILGDNILTERAIPSHDVIVNTIADPDVEADALRTLAKFLKRRNKTPVINDPLRVLETSRDRNYQRLKRRPGVIYPKTVRVKLDDAALANATALLARHDMKLPVILRVPGAHSGRRMAKVSAPEEMAQFVKDVGDGDLYVIEYVDCPYRDGFYRRMRAFFVDGQFHPVVHHVDNKWNVSGATRDELMAKHDWMVQAEQDFMADPMAFLGRDVYERLKALNELVRLDFFGIDFAVTPSGDVMIYELNPMMRHSFDYAQASPYLMPYLQKITQAFQDMLIQRVTQGTAPKRAAASRFAARTPQKPANAVP